MRQHAIALGQPIGDLAACTHDAQAAMMQTRTLCFEEVQRFLAGLFEGDLHAKRVLSLAHAILGVIRTASLAVHMIGHGLALARGLLGKHAIKQGNRRLSNPGIDLDAARRRWVPFVVGPRTNISVAMDWTEFDACGQATLMLSLLTRHGRAMPLVWLTMDNAALKDRRNEHQYQALVGLADALPADIAVCIAADKVSKVYDRCCEPVGLGQPIYCERASTPSLKRP